MKEGDLLSPFWRTGSLQLRPACDKGLAVPITQWQVGGNLSSCTRDGEGVKSDTNVTTPGTGQSQDRGGREGVLLLGHSWDRQGLRQR